jgi:hypothetical protein
MFCVSAADRATFSAEKTSMDQWRVRLADEQQVHSILFEFFFSLQFLF